MEAAVHFCGFLFDRLPIQDIYPEDPLETRAAALRPSEYEYWASKLEGEALWPSYPKK